VDLRGAAQLLVVGFVATLGTDAASAVLAIPLMYLAVEPFVRRYWPDSLISWQRLSRGGVRDPLVATHVLVGVLAAAIMGFLVYPGLEWVVTDLPLASAHHARLSGTLASLTLWRDSVANGLITVLIYLVLVVLMRLALRRLWLADVVAVTLFNVPMIESVMGNSLLLGAMMLVPSLAWIWVMRRFGFLAILVLFTFAAPLMFMPHHLGGWLGDRLMLFYTVPVLVAAWAVWVIVSARQPVPQGSPAYVA
jgi:hypothetical protein